MGGGTTNKKKTTTKTMGGKADSTAAKVDTANVAAKKKKDDDYDDDESNKDDTHTHHSDIPYAIKQGESLSKVLNTIVPLCILSLHVLPTDQLFELPERLSPWTIALIMVVGMNFVYVDGAMKCLMTTQMKQRKSGSSKGYDVQNYKYMMTELPVAAFFIGMASIGYNYEIPTLIIQSIFLHGIYDMMKHQYHPNVGVPYFPWYYNACAIFDFVYSILLYVVYIYIK